MSIKKIALAYSGGLDTSIIIPWLKDRYDGAEVIAVCVDVGQADDFSKLEPRALASGASKLHIVDARAEFVADYLFPMARAGAVYEGKYLLGTSIARPLQAKAQVMVALSEGADALAHGCTGKGNDQVRFEMAYGALAPHLQIIAPWRLWDIGSREDAIAYAESKGIPLGGISRTNIYSRDANIWHTSHEGAELEDPAQRPAEPLYQRTLSPQSAPDEESTVTLDFVSGIPIAVDGRKLTPFELLKSLNTVAAHAGVGRTDVVESRVVGMKSRGIYETPGGTLLYAALRELEMMCLDHDSLQTKLELAPRYASLVYGGKWFTPVREALDAFMANLARPVTGSVTLALYRGNVMVVSRHAERSVYNQELASFSSGGYDHADATGFINLYSLPVRVAAIANGKGA